MRARIELNDINAVKEFTAAVQTVPGEVRLIGKDENGADWNLSAKSLLCSLVVEHKLQEYRKHNAHEVDWNTLWVESDENIYSRIKKFVISGYTENVSV